MKSYGAADNSELCPCLHEVPLCTERDEHCARRKASAVSSGPHVEMGWGVMGLEGANSNAAALRAFVLMAEGCRVCPWYVWFNTSAGSQVAVAVFVRGLTMAVPGTRGWTHSAAWAHSHPLTASVVLSFRDRPGELRGSRHSGLRQKRRIHISPRGQFEV